MSKRKIFLLEAIAFMSVICILSLFSGGRTKSSLIKTDAKIDFIKVNSAKGEIKLKKDGEKWFLDDFEASLYDVKRMLKEIKTISVLNKIDNMKSDSKKEKYGFTDEKIISVEAFEGEKSVRKILIGKLSSTYSQTFIALGKGEDVFLAAGNLHDVFDHDAQELKDKKIYSLNKNDITSVSISCGKTWGVKKEGEKWISLPDGAKEEKIDEWLSSVSSLYASSWMEKNAEIANKEDLAAVFQTKDAVIKLKFYAYKDGFIVRKDDSNHEAFVKSDVAKRFFSLP